MAGPRLQIRQLAAVADPMRVLTRLTESYAAFETAIERLARRVLQHIQDMLDLSFLHPLTGSISSLMR